MEIFVLVTGPGKVHVRGHWRSLYDETLGAAVGDAPGGEDRPHDREGCAGEDDDDKLCCEKEIELCLRLLLRHSDQGTHQHVYRRVQWRRVRLRQGARRLHIA